MKFICMVTIPAIASSCFTMNVTAEYMLLGHPVWCSMCVSGTFRLPCDACTACVCVDHHNGACAVWHCSLGVVGSPDHYNKPCIVSHCSL